MYYVHVELHEYIYSADTGKTSYSSLNQSDGSIEHSNNQKTGETEKQYLVKWTGWSHLHNTWETGEYRCAQTMSCDYHVIVFRTNIAQSRSKRNKKIVQLHEERGRKAKMVSCN